MGYLLEVLVEELFLSFAPGETQNKPKPFQRTLSLAIAALAARLTYNGSKSEHTATANSNNSNNNNNNSNNNNNNNNNTILQTLSFPFLSNLSHPQSALSLLSLLSALPVALFSPSPTKLSIHPLFVRSQLSYFEDEATGQAHVLELLRTVAKAFNSTREVLNQIIQAAEQFATFVAPSNTFVRTMVPVAIELLKPNEENVEAEMYATESKTTTFGFLVAVFEHESSNKDTTPSILAMEVAVDSLSALLLQSSPTFDKLTSPSHVICAASTKILSPLYNNHSNNVLFEKLLNLLCAVTAPPPQGSSLDYCVNESADLTFEPILALSTTIIKSSFENVLFPDSTKLLSQAAWNLAVLHSYPQGYFDQEELNEEADGELEDVRNMVREVVRQVGSINLATETFLANCRNVIQENDPVKIEAAVHVFSALAKSVLKIVDPKNNSSGSVKSNLPLMESAVSTLSILLTKCLQSFEGGSAANKQAHSSLLPITRTLNLACASYAPFLFSFFSAKIRPNVKPELLEAVRQVIGRAVEFGLASCVIYPEVS